MLAVAQAHLTEGFRVGIESTDNSHSQVYGSEGLKTVSKVAVLSLVACLESRMKLQKFFIGHSRFKILRSVIDRNQQLLPIFQRSLAISPSAFSNLQTTQKFA